VLLSTVLVFFISLTVFFIVSGENEVSAEVVDNNQPNTMLKITSPVLPSYISFSDEETPLDIFYVKESLDREMLVNSYWHSSTILLLKRANRWFPVIDPILEENNIPEDFKYLALIESGFTKAVSARGAAGFWQFMEKTAREYKLEVNSNVDERYNVEKSTKAACQYFLDRYEEYQNWTLVAASYNAGKRRISESLEKQQADSYYDLYLNEETSRYIYRILAIKTIYEDPEMYGFQLSERDLYQELQFTEIEVDKPINDLVAFAQQYGMNYKLLKELNPWLRAGYLQNNSGKQYFIKVPLSN